MNLLGFAFRCSKPRVVLRPLYQSSHNFSSAPTTTPTTPTTTTKFTVEELYNPLAIPVVNWKKEVVETVIVPRHVLATPIRKDILHRCVVSELSKKRRGLASAKSRSEVQHSTRKVRQQKGSGHARVGDLRPPHYRGGGVAFPPKPRDFSTELPRKVVLLGQRIALTTKYALGSLHIIDSLKVPFTKTKDFVAFLNQNKWADEAKRIGPLLILGSEESLKEFKKPAMNISQVKVMKHNDINVYDLIKFKKIIIEKESLDYLLSQYKFF
eukprot:TRINITY_DN18005_c0_g1_i1.p1 TRINITY_DN18005_c0_g1~~TRINITY_DN18005_c0_g1_i1.p1  ORF type:complete len:268 (+),score=58.52 TRINITY_DN18005_c0_g1_i1:2-805(+)